MRLHEIFGRRTDNDLTPRPPPGTQLDSKLRNSIGRALAHRTRLVAVPRNPVALSVTAVEVCVVYIEIIEILRLCLRDDAITLTKDTPNDRNVLQLRWLVLGIGDAAAYALRKGSNHRVAASAPVQERADHPRFETRGRNVELKIAAASGAVSSARFDTDPLRTNGEEAGGH